MTDPELKKRTKRMLFAFDQFIAKDFSPYWLREAKQNRKWIERHFDKEDEKETDKLQLKLFK